MGLQYKDIETNEVLFANEPKHQFDLFKAGSYAGSYTDLYEMTKTVDMPLRERKEIKILELKEQCTAAVTAGFASSTLDHSFGFKQHDQDNFTQQLAAIAAGMKGNVRWKTLDAGTVEFTVEEFLSIIQDGKIHRETQQALYWDLEQQVASAEKANQLHEIKWKEEA